MERQTVSARRPEVTHQPFNSYIVNASALRSSEYHRIVTGHHWEPVSRAEWDLSITQGLIAWFRECPPKESKGKGKQDCEDDANNREDDEAHSSDDDEGAEGDMQNDGEFDDDSVLHY